MSISRRQFVNTTAAIAASAAVSSRGSTLPAGQDAIAPRSSLDQRSLVLIELSGGNDGLNTVIPFTDPAYYAARPSLAIPARHVLKLTDAVGLHPAMPEMAALFGAGQLAIIQGVGYPNHSRSHFRSMAAWHRGIIDGSAGNGWVAGGLAGASSVYAGESCPDVLLGTSSRPMEMPAVVRTPKAAYPEGNRLAAVLASFGQMIVQRSGPRLFHVSLSGFDTHTRQAQTQGPLLGTLSSALGAFMADLRAEKRDGDVVVMIFSEFGRRVRENTSAGTDHGAASVMFVAGGSVKGGIFGTPPSLTRLQDGDLIHTTDFRDCYATLRQNWLGVAPDTAFAGRTNQLAFV